MKKPKFSQRQQQALDLYVKLMRAGNRVTSSIHHHLQHDNLTHSQFAILETLYHLGPQNQSELSRKILKSNANVTTVVDSLEKKHLVSRMRSETDRRVVKVHLTSAGDEMLAKIFPRHVEVIEKRLAILTDQEQQQLAELLKKLGKG
ncbi:MAG: MarR family transcriptional regulator [Desulfuromonadales bacterium]|nr:MarR family transcriptional regulator [Desulfuromonadales bacterium]MBN2792551.1 MarR family transcriptional regulator [Desulfuromonadales bacterium]